MGMRYKGAMAEDPVLIAYSVKDGTPERPAQWTRLGVAFPHERGAGLTVFINALPLDFDGRIVLVEPSADYANISPAGPISAGNAAQLHPAGAA
jgi:hypothetical protein